MTFIYALYPGIASVTWHTGILCGREEGYTPRISVYYPSTARVTGYFFWTRLKTYEVEKQTSQSLGLRKSPVITR